MLSGKIKIYIAYLLIFFSCLPSFAQDSQSADFNFLVSKIKKDYPGYRDREKNNRYKFNKFLLELGKYKTKDTFALLSKVTNFFNDLHLVLYDYNITKYIDSAQCEKDRRAILFYLNHKVEKKDDYEGFWLSDYGNCIIGLKKVKTSPLTYKGYIIETKTKAPIGYCVFKLVKEKNGDYYTDYKEEGLGYRIFLKSRFKNNNLLYLNSYGKWSKITGYKSKYLDSCKTFNYDISFSQLDKKIVLLTMPDFGGYNVKIVDSLIKTNDSIISNANLLILDIRNNMGGTIRNYLPLVPFVFTGTMTRPDGYQLCSEDAIADLEDDIKKLESRVFDTLKASIYLQRRNLMVANKGKFLFAKGEIITNNLKRMKFPTDVAIIVNNNCLSAAELMLLDFKQSKKVKVFGERTGGAVDYLDAIQIKLPKSGNVLFIATSKRVINSHQPKYDNIGIEPDVFIPESTQNWIEFVKRQYEPK